MIDLTLTHEGSLLLTLEEISQLVARSRNTGETLANIVRLIQGRYAADVCSVYFLEPERGELVLSATVGLKPESVGCVRMQLDEGLTGLVAETLGPVQVDDAFQHPRFKYFPEAGEDPYHSFLGVPLVEGGDLQGVLVVQTVEPRSFSAHETRMLITVATQIAPLLSGARFLDRIAAGTKDGGVQSLPDVEPLQLSQLRGTSLSPGMGVGEVYVVNGLDAWQDSVATRTTDCASERERLARALEAARDEITHLSQRVSELVGEDHGAILQAQLMLLQDRMIERDLAECVLAGNASEEALMRTMAKYVARMQQIASPLLQERIYDVKDIFRRILWHLRPHAQAAAAAGARVVLVAPEASVLDLFAVERERLAAVVVERGGPNCHAAILARSLGVPMVGQVPEFVSRVRPGQLLLVNGAAGEVFFDPSPKVLAAHAQGLSGPTISCEGPPSAGEARRDRIRVEANVNMLFEVEAAVRQRAGGVGLFRTEFLFLARRTLPTEEEQVRIYRKLLGMLEGRPASIRTFDLRPDKVAHLARLSSAAAAALDWRRVLDLPPLQILFKNQVRAILRAACAGPARILVPLVSSTEQLDFIVETVEEAREELLTDGLEFESRVPLGIMIEAAAAAAMVETWADRVDYFALGTNDLIASALGSDRDPPAGTPPLDPLHPGVLRLIQQVIAAVHRWNRPVTVCGELAADPEGLIALAALQVDALSVPVPSIGSARRTLDDLSAETLAGLADHIPHLRTASQARTLFRHWSTTARRWEASRQCVPTPRAWGRGVNDREVNGDP